MGYFSTTETEDHIIREYNEKTGSPKIVVRLPKYELTPREKMGMYLTALQRLRRDAETARRLCLREGDYHGYLHVDTIEKESQAQLWAHYIL